MNENNMYDQFSQNYDRFVNWDERLSSELPFLIEELNPLTLETQGKVSVLDAACGTGQHVIALAEEGFKCTGADFSEGMVKIARHNAEISNYDIPFTVAGFGQLTEVYGGSAFDGLMCLGNSLPHVLTEASLLQTLDDFHKVLRKGGKLILQNRNFDKVLAEHSRWMPPQTYRENDSTWIFARFYDFSPDERLMFNIQILTSQFDEPFEQQVVSTKLWPLQKAELMSYLKQSGFNQIEIYGDLSGTPFHLEKSGNLVITARAG